MLAEGICGPHFDRELAAIGEASSLGMRNCSVGAIRIVSVKEF